MIYNTWDIVAVPFPFTDKNQVKKRPALVINQIDYQQTHKHLILLMITSAKNSDWKSDIVIKDLKSTGLTTSSVIRFKMFTLDERLILKKVGTLAKVDSDNVIINLKQALPVTKA